MDATRTEKPRALERNRIEAPGANGASVIVSVGRIVPGSRVEIVDQKTGPWGHILRIPDVEDRCLFHLAGLDELPARVAEHNAQRG